MCFKSIFKWSCAIIDVINARDTISPRMDSQAARAITPGSILRIVDGLYDNNSLHILLSRPGRALPLWQCSINTNVIASGCVYTPWTIFRIPVLQAETVRRRWWIFWMVCRTLSQKRLTTTELAAFFSPPSLYNFFLFLSPTTRILSVSPSLSLFSMLF